MYYTIPYPMILVYDNINKCVYIYIYTYIHTHIYIYIYPYVYHARGPAEERLQAPRGDGARQKAGERGLAELREGSLCEGNPFTRDFPLCGISLYNGFPFITDFPL